ncbi:MAG TPA: fatty acid desaturase [Solirubrobacteraceae bacterium]|nr:fatty acid desaturase [Solirubrobacteraceae bacterium]
MSVSVQPRLGETRAERHALPDPGELVPRLSWPIVGIFSGALTVFAASSWLALDHRAPRALTIALNAVAIFVMFTVLHDASHYSISSRRWVNGVFGRAAMLFVSSSISFGAFGFIHIEHHRHSNDDDRDPDTFASHGKWWQLPFRWAAMDLAYVPFYAQSIKRRPRAEVAETFALMTLTVAVIVTTIVTGSFWLLLVIYLIPERIAMFALAWWFDWLPHHGLEDTQRDNRYRATRNRVGMEWLFTPLLLSQNYHLVHHLHPSVPFHRYLATWRRNEEAYLERDAAIGTVFGQQLNPEEFREWKKLNRKLLKLLPVRMPNRSSASHAVFHRVPVKGVHRLTEDSVEITFDVPAWLREEFRFDAGQHLTVRTDLGGQGVRRNYSICSPATGGELAIAVKGIPGGAFSTFALERLHPGDELELMTPTGSFGTPLDPLARRNYVAIAAGSGITPILSILRTTLEIETESRFTLIYGNRTAETTMFRHELDKLESRYADRLEILHVHTRDPNHPPELSGRIDEEKLGRWLSNGLAPATVHEWFLCGPLQLVTSARQTLLDHSVDLDRIHLELFYGYDRSTAGSRDYAAASVTIRLSGTEQTVELEPGDTILEAALQVRDDTPYACMGGACGTCKAKLLAGTVEMDQNFALGKADLSDGYVLTCQSHPTTPAVTVDYDA